MITTGFKNTSSSALRASLAIGIGAVVLVTCLQKADPFALLVKVCASFVIAAGIFSLIYGLLRRSDKDFGLMMVNAAVDLALGIVMFCLAGVIAKVFFYVIAIVIMGFGLWQIITLLSARKYVKTGIGAYIMPMLVVLLGALVIAPNFGKAVGYICSAALILYGVSEICTLCRMRKAIKIFEASVAPDDQPQQEDDRQ